MCVWHERTGRRKDLDGRKKKEGRKRRWCMLCLPTWVRPCVWCELRKTNEKAFGAEGKERQRKRRKEGTDDECSVLPFCGRRKNDRQCATGRKELLRSWGGEDKTRQADNRQTGIFDTHTCRHTAQACTAAFLPCALALWALCHCTLSLGGTWFGCLQPGTTPCLSHLPSASPFVAAHSMPLPATHSLPTTPSCPACLYTHLHLSLPETLVCEGTDQQILRHVYY